MDFSKGELVNLRNNKVVEIYKFYDAQLAIYLNGGLL